MRVGRMMVYSAYLYVVCSFLSVLCADYLSIHISPHTYREGQSQQVSGREGSYNSVATIYTTYIHYQQFTTNNKQFYNKSFGFVQQAYTQRKSKHTYTYTYTIQHALHYST